MPPSYLVYHLTAMGLCYSPPSGPDLVMYSKLSYCIMVNYMVLFDTIGSFVSCTYVTILLLSAVRKVRPVSGVFDGSLWVLKLLFLCVWLRSTC